MKVLSPGLDILWFWDLLTRNKNRALLLDYDGTLAPFRVERDKAVPYFGVRKILEKIIATGGCRVVVISGRSVEDLLPLLGLQVTLDIWGSHGRERLYADGAYKILPVGAKTDKALKEVLDWAGASGLEPYCELKPGCIAFHVRGLPPEKAEEILTQVRSVSSSLEQGHSLGLHRFDGGLEFRATGCHKGQAVETIFQESGSDMVAAYLGDDRTDEDAFRAIKGRGIGVLVRSELRTTEADFWIKPPEELLQFLSEWARACNIRRL
jgi:trehalose 6-phosphate phosphatase